MAQDITLMGASFSDVPAVDLPKTGGGTARFTDVSDTTATASDVAQGKVFHLADGSQATGTSSGGGGGDTGDLKAIIERTTTNPTLPSDLTKIGASAFKGCSSLALTELPSGVKSINDQAFYQCVNLALTSLPNMLTSIGDSAFYSCANMTLSELPSGVVSIGGYAFYQCNSITISELPSGVNVIASSAFQRCSNIRLISCDGALTTLGSGAFTGSSSYPMQLASASFPNMTISSLGTVFGNSSSSNACRQLAFADIGKTKALAANAFANCNALQTLVLRRSDAVCTLSNVSALTNTPMRGYNSLTGTVYVPSALIETYKTAANWSTLYDGGTVEFVAIEGSEYELD